MNNYYLIAFDKEPKIIEITLDMNGEKTKVTSTTIQNIDKMTSMFDMNKIKEHLLSKGKISSKDVEIQVVHQTKYNDEVRIKTFPVLTDNDYLRPTNKLKVFDIERLIMKFVNLMKKDDFRSFVEYYYTDLNSHTLRNIQRIFATMFNNKSVKEELVDYKDARSLLSIITHYNRFKDLKKYQEYLFNINRYIIEHKQELVAMTNSKITQGQMSFSFENGNLVYHDMYDAIKDLEIEETDEVIDYYELYDRLHYEPWDDPYFEACAIKNCFPEDAYQKMTLNDRARAGMITALEFKKEMIKRSERRK